MSRRTSLWAAAEANGKESKFEYRLHCLGTRLRLDFPALKASGVAHINGQPHVAKGPTTGLAFLTSERARLVTCPRASSSGIRIRPMVIRSPPEPHITCALSYPSNKYDSYIAATAGSRRTGVHRLASSAVIMPRPVREADVGRDMPALVS